ncbi:rhamnulokinase [Spiroplasma chinense]|uniref:Rhamnulokinase n=1 Tax=Spiroplasma chinense TaxID=216932 RepID=A0A5B9Y4W8_9MOLU|nr:rhamnulokinase family protein [Spiroplasma chinense]QEH62000.1 rhamnulokinase [Spiroplasma chinense]
MNNYICLDIGASSGKMSLAKLVDGKIVFEKLHVFKNLMIKKAGEYFWDVDSFFSEIIIGLKKAKSAGIDNCYLGIDTWGVDYVSLNEKGERVMGAYSYRDNRTVDFFKKHKGVFDKETMYLETGIVSHEFNTVYQLYVQKIWEQEEVKKILLMPDYFIYRLTGEMIAEATNLSTTQLFDIDKKDFIPEILEKLKIDKSLFGRVVYPGEEIGFIKEELIEEYDLPKCKVIAVASHDTSSAIASAPLETEDDVFISSGTWSLLGIESKERIINKLTFKSGFTNQLGVEDSITFLKNIAGMWILQEIENNLSNKFDIEELLNEALKNDSFNYIMDCEDIRYLNPENMIFEIWKYFEQTRQNIPHNIGALIRCVVDSLALCYYDNIKQLCELTNKEINKIYILGGGSRNKILNQEVANISKKIVVAGPSDATMIGNVIVQMIAKNEIKDIKEARKIIKESFEIETYRPDGEDYKYVINKYNLIKEMRKE